MHKRMTAAARAELADAIRPRYAAAAAKEKRKILEEFIAATGYHEKSAIRVLNSAPTLQAPPEPATRHRSMMKPFALR